MIDPEGEDPQNKKFGAAHILADEPRFDQSHLTLRHWVVESASCDEEAVPSISKAWLWSWRISARTSAGTRLGDDVSLKSRSFWLHLCRVQVLVPGMDGIMTLKRR